MCVWGALREMEDDYTVLYGYLYSSRYITRDVMNRYGLNPRNYTGPVQLPRIRERLTQCLDPDMRVQTREELVTLLGVSFEWVHTAAPCDMDVDAVRGKVTSSEAIEPEEGTPGVSHVDRYFAR